MSGTPETLVTWVLGMEARTEFRAAFLNDERWAELGAILMPMARFDPDFYRFLYKEVGENWYWRVRTDWDDETLNQRHQNEMIQLDVLYIHGIPAGYVELAIRSEEDRQAGAMEIAYFGIREEFFGLGLGKHLLSHGIKAAWDAGAKRLWLTTCNLDAPQALSNYLKRGFRITETIEEPMPDIYLD